MKVEVIDFSGWSAETTEPIPPRGDKHHLAYYWEAGHFKKSFLQNAGFVEDLFAADGEVKEERAAISGMMRLPSQSS